MFHHKIISPLVSLFSSCFQRVTHMFLKVGDIQQEEDSSLRHALDLAAGRRCDKIIQQTMKDAFTIQTLEWIGCTCEDDPNANDILEFHSLLLLNHVGAIVETATYHQSYPWKVILFLWPSAQPALLEEMRSMWEFVTTVVDALDPQSQVSKSLVWTRSQAFRECFIAAEYLGEIDHWTVCTCYCQEMSFNIYR